MGLQVICSVTKSLLFRVEPFESGDGTEGVASAFMDIWIKVIRIVFQ